MSRLIITALSALSSFISRDSYDDWRKRRKCVVWSLSCGSRMSKILAICYLLLGQGFKCYYSYRQPVQLFDNMLTDHLLQQSQPQSTGNNVLNSKLRSKAKQGKKHTFYLLHVIVVLNLLEPESGFSSSSFNRWPVCPGRFVLLFAEQV